MSTKNNFSDNLPSPIKIVLKALFFVILTFIFIGDSTILLFTTVFNVVVNVLNFIGSTARQLFTSVLSWIHSFLKLPNISIPKIQRKTYQKDVKKRSLLRSIFSKLKYFILGIIVATLIVLFDQGYGFVKSLPNPKLIGSVNYPVSTQIFDRNGNLLYDVFRDETRTPIDIQELPEHVIQATLSIEDKNFYNHKGISPVGGILRALKDSYQTGELQGGSTITQQLVKTSLLTPEKTIDRKVREAILALWTERMYSKSQILQMYLNQVPYGGSAYGIEEASKKYFNKSAKELEVYEAAFLAGLTRAPSTYSPYIDPQRSVSRRNEVLRNMLELGYITNEEFTQYTQEPLEVEPPKTFIRAPHFVFYVISELEKEYGIRRVEEGGLRVVTSLDIELQEQVEDILQEEIAEIQHLNVNNGAVLVTAPSTGEILAMVGSKDYFEEPYGAFNVTVAERQPGSSVKPLMYSLALSRDYTAASIIDDSPVVFDVAGSRPYRPVNYDGTYHGQVPLRYALANSYNIPAVKVLNTLGVSDFIDHAEDLGITTWDEPERYGLSLTLGGGEVKMIDMAAAYGTFANYGDRVDTNPFLSVIDFKGETLYSSSENEIERKNVLTPEVSFILSDILSDNFARQFAFGQESDLFIPDHKVAVKTGTSNEKRDNWTIGYNRKYLTAVWVGNNDNSPMHPVLTSGVTGASPIWNRVMQEVLERNITVSSDIQPPSEFSVPEGVLTRKCFFNKDEYFVSGTEETAECGRRVYNVSPTEVENTESNSNEQN